jgi:hypothetical protein
MAAVLIALVLPPVAWAQQRNFDGPASNDPSQQLDGCAASCSSPRASAGGATSSTG